MDRIAAAALALLLGGCLAPQDIEEEVPSDEQVNHAPRIVPDQATVEGMVATRLTVQTSCDRIRFRVAAIEDQDLADDLWLRFFVDYDRGCESCRHLQDEVWLRASDATRALRTTEFEYELQLPLDAGIHVVEAVVSDGFADDTGRTVAEGRGFDAVAWVIDVVDAESQACQPSTP